MSGLFTFGVGPLSSPGGFISQELEVVLTDNTESLAVALADNTESLDVVLTDNTEELDVVLTDNTEELVVSSDGTGELTVTLECG